MIDGLDTGTRFLERCRISEIAEKNFRTFRHVCVSATKSPNVSPLRQKLTDDFSAEKTCTTDHEIHKG
jgi:hypothetical protein